MPRPWHDNTVDRALQCIIPALLVLDVSEGLPVINQCVFFFFLKKSMCSMLAGMDSLKWIFTCSLIHYTLFLWATKVNCLLRGWLYITRFLYFGNESLYIRSIYLGVDGRWSEFVVDIPRTSFRINTSKRWRQLLIWSGYSTHKFWNQHSQAPKTVQNLEWIFHTHSLESTLPGVENSSDFGINIPQTSFRINTLKHWRQIRIWEWTSYKHLLESTLPSA